MNPSTLPITPSLVSSSPSRSSSALPQPWAFFLYPSHLPTTKYSYRLSWMRYSGMNRVTGLYIPEVIEVGAYVELGNPWERNKECLSASGDVRMELNLFEFVHIPNFYSHEDDEERLMWRLFDEWEWWKRERMLKNKNEWDERERRENEVGVIRWSE